MGWWWVLLIAATFSPRTPVCDVPAWRRSIDGYVRAHPRAEAVDLYKLAHQGILGSEHAVTDTASAVAWMQRELATLSPAPQPVTDSSVSEPLPPVGRFVRVHLRPFLAHRGDPATLVRAFVATANGARGDTAQFACVERALSTLAPSPTFTRLASLIRERRRTGFDAVHHSAGFEAAYAPAYRVIDAALLSALLAGSDGSSVPLRQPAHP